MEKVMMKRVIFLFILIVMTKPAWAADCGTPFVNRGGQCVLECDSAVIEVNQPYEIDPFVKLNCQGKTLVPGPNFGADQPAFFSSANGWKLQNCNVGSSEKPFPFAVWIIRNPLSQEILDDPGTRSLTQIKILGNHFTTSSISISSYEGNNYSIKDNTMCCGPAMGVFRNSSHIEIKNNSIQMTATSPGSLPGVPAIGVSFLLGAPTLVVV